MDDNNIRKCLHCNTLFTYKRSNQIYCSKTCKDKVSDKNYYQRNKEKFKNKSRKRLEKMSKEERREHFKRNSLMKKVRDIARREIIRENNLDKNVKERMREILKNMDN